MPVKFVNVYKSLAIFVFLPFMLYSQEQVSDIQYYGVYEPTLLAGRAGFALIGGEQYFLQEQDSLIISKITNGLLQKHAVIKKFDNKPKRQITILPNRSLFDIIDGKYYRFFINGVQVIDIKDGAVLFQFDFEKEGFRNTTPTTIYRDKIFFTAIRNSKLTYNVLDINSGLVSELNLPEERFNYPQLLNFIPGVTAGSKLYMFNATENKDYKIFESDSVLKLSTYSPADNVIAILENHGALWLVDYELRLTKTSCNLNNVDDIKLFKLTGNKIVVIYRLPDMPENDLVEVWDIRSCNKDMSFITEVRDYYAAHLRFTIIENNDPRVTIFGYYGENPTDGFSRGLYYFIDHERKKYSAFSELSQIVSFTPFVLDSTIYCTGIDGSFWGSESYVLKYELNNSRVSKLFPTGQNNSNSVVLGYPEANEIILANNTKKEEASLWKLNLHDTFTPLTPLNFLYNLGVHLIGKIMPMQNRLYFTNKVGLYSMSDDAELEMPYPNAPKIAGYNSGGLPVTQYGNKIGFCEFVPNSIIFRVLDTSTGMRDSLVINEKISEHTIVPAGPYIFFSEGNSNSILQYFDLRNKSVHSYERLPWMIGPNMYHGEKRAIYLQKSFTGNQPPIVHLIDYESGKITDFNFNLQRQINIVRGFDDAFYLIDQNPGTERCKIQLLRRDGTFQTIYNGDGYFYRNSGFAHDPSDKVVLFNLMFKGQTTVLISNDQKNTKIRKIHHDIIASVNTSILSFRADKFILRTRESDGFHYWLYNALGDLTEIEGPSAKIFRAAGFSDSLAIILFSDHDSTLFMTKYDYINDIRDAHENLTTSCNFLFSVTNVVRLSANLFLLTASCQSGMEPWILDIEKGSMSILSDINPDILSSFPTDFVWFKGWLYFTATLSDNSRQWFRLWPDSSSPTLEPVSLRDYSLKVYPTPASEVIHFDQNLEMVSLYNYNGIQEFQIYNYMNGQALPIHNLAQGIYYYHAISTKKNFISGKVIIVK